MNSDDLDLHISGDLAALAEDSRRNLGHAPLAALGGNDGPYRDGRAGAAARLEAVIDARRRELALMPLALARVFVNRGARAAAGAAAALTALVTAVTAADPLLLRLAAWLVPELTVTVAAVGAVAVVLVAYVVGGAIAERVFERRMRRAISAGAKDSPDLDALVAGPIDQARSLARRIDGWAVALPLAGLAALVSLFGFLILSYPPFRLRHFGGVLDIAAVVGGNLIYVVAAVLVAVAAAAALGRACYREARSPDRPRLIGWTEHWGALAAAIGLGTAATIGLSRALFAYEFMGRMPAPETRLVLALAATAAFTLATAWLLLRLRRVEQRRLEASEVWS